MDVKQWDTLSTTLFNIFLNELPNEFKFDENGPVTVGDVEISCLLYADDLVLMSTSPEALQRCVTRLEKYCERWKLEVNLKKTKILIFNKQGLSSRNTSFILKNVENVKEYKYLGFIFTCSGLDNSGINNLLKKAKKAWFAIQYYLKSSKNKKIATYLHLFDTQAKPILLYSCESWVDSLKNNGNLSDTIQKNAIKRFHIGVLKQLLCVHKKTTNVAMLLETGRHPITISAQVQAIKYFFRFRIIEHDKLLKSYYEEEKLYSVRNDKFIKYIINTLDNIGMGNIWKEQQIENKDLSKDATLVKCIKTRLTDISSQSLISSLKNNPGKLTFLTKIKDTHKFEEYLSIDNFEHRRAISKLRTSSHKLEIETGRWNNIQKEDRNVDIVHWVQ